MDQWISSYCVSAPRASRADEEGEEGEVEEETVAPLTTEEKLEELNQQLREGSIGPHQVPCQKPKPPTRGYMVWPDSFRPPVRSSTKSSTSSTLCFKASIQSHGGACVRNRLENCRP